MSRKFELQEGEWCYGFVSNMLNMSWLRKCWKIIDNFYSIFVVAFHTEYLNFLMKHDLKEPLVNNLKASIFLIKNASSKLHPKNDFKHPRFAL